MESSRHQSGLIKSLCLPESSQSNLPCSRSQDPGPRVRHQLHALQNPQIPGQSDLSAMARRQTGLRPSLSIKRRNRTVRTGTQNSCGQFGTRGCCFPSQHQWRRQCIAG